MRGLICRQWGGIEQLQVGEAPMPRPGPDEVLIRVKATAVNYADAIMVAGRYQTKPELPFSPGLETAGVIEACGPGVKGLKPGARFLEDVVEGREDRQQRGNDDADQRPRCPARPQDF